MKERCPNAKKYNVGRDPRTRKPRWICKVTCQICRGGGTVQDCPDCSGAGLRVGGVLCTTCATCGKVPST